MTPWVKARVAFIAVSCLTVTTGAHSDTWIGRWGAPNCGRDATTITMSRARLDLSTFDMVCQIKEVQQRDGLFILTTICPGPGLPSNAHFSLRVDGDSLEFVGQQQGLEFDPKRFRRCASLR